MSIPGRPQPLRPTELAEALLDPGWADREDARCLVVDLTAGADDALEADLPSRLATLAIPLIGFGTPAPGALADAMDVVVDDNDELNTLLAQVEACPHACAVLVQVLRSSERLPIPDALALESLGYATLQAGPEFARWLAGRAPGNRSRAAPPAEDVMLLERRGSRLAIVLNAPHNRNALSTAMRDALTEAFRLVQMDAGVESVDVRANGPSFSSGGDLTEFGTLQDPASAHEIRMRRMPARYLAACAARCHFHVHGACVGAGIELSAFAGRITASGDAFFQLPEVARGLIPGAGGGVSSPRRIGRQRTAYMALTNKRMDADQALAWGLVDGVEG